MSHQEGNRAAPAQPPQQQQSNKATAHNAAASTGLRVVVLGAHGLGDASKDLAVHALFYGQRFSAPALANTSTCRFDTAFHFHLPDESVACILPDTIEFVLTRMTSDNTREIVGAGSFAWQAYVCSGCVAAGEPVDVTLKGTGVTADTGAGVLRVCVSLGSTEASLGAVAVTAFFAARRAAVDETRRNFAAYARTWWQEVCVVAC
jgi:hypothetical protein